MFWFKKRKPFPGSKSQFFEILSRQAAKTLEGLEALWNFAENGTKENANLVRNVEREADELRRILIQELDQTFVTPLDREDIYNLSRAIDDVVDDILAARAAKKELEITAIGFLGTPVNRKVMKKGFIRVGADLIIQTPEELIRFVF